MLEIPGNHHILTTILAPEGASIDAGAAELFSIPIQSQPGWRRIGLDTDVPKLTDQILAVRRQDARLEHAYDY